MEHPSPFTSCYRDLCFWHSWMTELLLKKALMLFLSAAPKEFRGGFFALFACLSQHLIIILYMCLAKPFLSSNPWSSWGNGLPLQRDAPVMKTTFFDYLMYGSVKSNDWVYFVVRFHSIVQLLFLVCVFPDKLLFMTSSIATSQQIHLKRPEGRYPWTDCSLISWEVS